MKKSIFAVFVVALLGIATVGIAQSAWTGTGWISSGATVSSQNLKSNLDYLYETKAHKPQNCHGTGKLLGWFNGDWTCDSPAAPQDCTFNGTTVASGNSVTAYQASSVPFGSTCQSETRSCTNGVLSGTFAAASCSIAPAASCTFDGNTVANGDSVTAYQASSVPFGSTCQSETRSCTNGVLSGTFAAASCTAAPASACVVNGVTVNHGDDAIFYENSIVAYGETCQSETRSCSNGTMSGSFDAVSCSVAPPERCVFNGSNLENGDQVTAFQSETVPYNQTCQSETRTCNDGTLSGAYEYNSCEVLKQDPVTYYRRDFVQSREESYSCGWFGTCTRTVYYFEGSPGITFTNPDGYGGPNGFGGLASDPTTLRALCSLKGYDYLIDQAPRNRSGFREYTSPGNNSLLYSIGGSWQVRGARHDNRSFAGGWIRCSDTNSGGGGNSDGGGGGGGEPSDTVREIQQF